MLFLKSFSDEPCRPLLTAVLQLIVPAPHSYCVYITISTPPSSCWTPTAPA